MVTLFTPPTRRWGPRTNPTPSHSKDDTTRVWKQAERKKRSSWSRSQSAPRMVHRGTRSKAAQDRRVERGSLRGQEEPYQVSSVKLLERSECGRPATLKKEKGINALNHGYSRADCRGNERDAASDRPSGARYRRSEGTPQRPRQEQKQGQRQREIQRQKGISERQTRRFPEFEEEPWDETNETEPEERSQIEMELPFRLSQWRARSWS